MIDPNTPVSVVNAWRKNTMLEHIDLEITEIGEDYVKGTMPVNHKTHQPAGLLHGGASAVLIETLGSVGSTLLVDMEKEAVVGIEINANHLKGVRSGVVTGTAKLKHGGRKTHLWQVDVQDEEGRLVCTGRLTVMVIDKK